MFIRDFMSRVIEQWLVDLDNIMQLCVDTLPPGRGLDMANFVAQIAEKHVRFASARQTTSLGPLNFYWTLPYYIPPNTLPGVVDYDRLPKNLRARIESVLHLISDLPIPVAPADTFVDCLVNAAWDQNMPPSFHQWRSRLCFIGDSL